MTFRPGMRPSSDLHLKIITIRKVTLIIFFYFNFHDPIANISEANECCLYERKLGKIMAIGQNHRGTALL